MAYTQIDYEIAGEIRIIRFNRPEVRNCIGPTTHRELVDAWDAFARDDGAKVAILTGAEETPRTPGLKRGSHP